jgi:GDP-4-dehydro-6-deoxy-D-mannose reductase
MFEAASGTKVKLEKDPGKIRPSEAATVFGSAKKIEADTGWRPRISLKQTISDLLEYWRLRVSSEVAQSPATER